MGGAENVGMVVGAQLFYEWGRETEPSLLDGLCLPCEWCQYISMVMDVVLICCMCRKSACIICLDMVLCV